MKTNRKMVVRKAWSITEIAGAIGVSRQMVDKLLRQGRIPASVFTSKDGRGKRKVRDTLEFRKWLASPQNARRLSVAPKSPQAAALQKLASLKKSLDKANQDTLLAIQRAGKIAREAGAEIGVLKTLMPRPVWLNQLSEITIGEDERRRLLAVPAYNKELLREGVSRLLLATGAVNRKKKENGEKIHEVPTLPEMFNRFQRKWIKLQEGAEKNYPQAKWSGEDIVKIKRQLKPMVDLFERVSTSQQ